MNEQVKLSVFYPHPPEKVWQALTDCRVLNAWMMKNDFEPRLGHKFKFESNSLPGLETTIYCEVLELDEPKRLVYTWQDSNTGEPSLVIWKLTPVKDGTQLELRHRQAGYVTTAIAKSNSNKKGNFSTEMFLYQPVINATKLISKPSSLRSGTFEQLDSFIDDTNLRAQWSYRLNQKLPQALGLIVDF